MLLLCCYVCSVCDFWTDWPPTTRPNRDETRRSGGALQPTAMHNPIHILHSDCARATVCRAAGRLRHAHARARCESTTARNTSYSAHSSDQRPTWICGVSIHGDPSSKSWLSMAHGYHGYHKHVSILHFASNAHGFEIVQRARSLARDAAAAEHRRTGAEVRSNSPSEVPTRRQYRELHVSRLPASAYNRSSRQRGRIWTRVTT